MGRRQHSESIEVALDIESGGLMNHFDWSVQLLVAPHNFLSRFGSLLV